MKNMHLIIIIFILLTTVFSLCFFIIQDHFLKNKPIATKEQDKEEVTKPLLEYSFNNLKNTKFVANAIDLGKIAEKTDEHIQQQFYFSTPKTPTSKELDKVSGLATIPNNEGEYPVIVMYRGFIPEESFQSGAGTSPSAIQLANSGYITLAPDFLGFGESSNPSTNPFENRFQTYTTSLSLLESIKNLNVALDKEYEGTISADLEKIGIWGHSNGGHIALASLAITGRRYPTVLWAPVSKSFPYSVLYYTDETDDQGKGMRKALYNFEEIYNTEDFSPERYYKWISTPIQINQGTLDPEVPFWWSDELVDTLEEYNQSVEYNKYPGANHNLQPSWNEVVSNTIEFYEKQLKN